jgi:hypothetical protein
MVRVWDLSIVQTIAHRIGAEIRLDFVTKQQTGLNVAVIVPMKKREELNGYFNGLVLLGFAVRCLCGADGHFCQGWHSGS